MSPDDIGGFEDADLPGLPDDAPRRAPETEGDLPGLPPGPSTPESTDRVPVDPPAEVSDWTEAELDDWYWGEFGGDRRMSGAFGQFPSDASLSEYDIGMLFEQLQAGYDAYVFWSNKLSLANEDTSRAWSSMSVEDRARFRRGWEDYETALARADTTESVVPELAPLPIEADPTRADLVRKRQPSARMTWPLRLREAKTPGWPRWIVIGGGIGVLGLVLVFVVFVMNGNQDGAGVGTATPTSMDPSTTVQAAVPDSGTSAGALDDVAPGVSFPSTWSYTATKTASIVPAPDFMTPTPIGVAIPWRFDLVEDCTGSMCTYSTVIFPLIPESVFGEIPAVEWEVDGSDWTLDVTYQTVQSSFGDTVCVIENHEVFELTVTETGADGTVPAAFAGTWLQGVSLDLAASTGDVADYCGEPWSLVDEWSLVGETSS